MWFHVYVTSFQEPFECVVYKIYFLLIQWTLIWNQHGLVTPWTGMTIGIGMSYVKSKCRSVNKLY